MTFFELHTPIVAAHTDALRRDADALTPLPGARFPSAYPYEAFHRAVSAAIDVANDRAAGFQYEARRVAAAMDLTVTAAGTADSCLSQGLGRVL